MVWKTVSTAAEGNSTTFDGADMNKISNVLSGTTDADLIIKFKKDQLRLRNTANTYETTLDGADITTNKTITLPNATDTLVGKATTDTLTNKTLTAPRFADDGYIADTNSNELLQLGSISNAINHIKISNAITNGDPLIESYGGNTNINLKLKTKGTGKVVITGSDATKELDFDTSTQNGDTTCTLSTGSSTGTRTITLPNTTSTLAMSNVSNTFTGVQTFSSTIQPNTIALTGGQKIRSNDSTEIGIYVRNETASVGSAGTLQVPEYASATAPTSATLDTQFGLVQGSIGLWKNTTTPTANRIYLRTSAGTWHYVALTAV